MRDCPFAGCLNKVSGPNFCCSKHWHGMSREHRDEAFHAYRRYAIGEISIVELVEEQARIADVSDFSGDSIRGETIYSNCDKCGANCFLVRFGVLGIILLDTEHFGITGDFVVVGGIAYSGPDAEKKIRTAPALAKLRRHVCSGSRCQSVPYEEWKKGRADARNIPHSRPGS